MHLFSYPCSFKNIIFETVSLYAYKSRSTSIWKKLGWIYISNTYQDNKPKKNVLRDNGSNALYSPYERLLDYSKIPRTSKIKY